MGQLENCWVSKAVFDEELKRRQGAEKCLDEVLKLVESWERSIESVTFRSASLPMNETDGISVLRRVVEALRVAIGEHTPKGTEKPDVLRPPMVTVQVEDGQDGMTIERILVKAGAAQRLEEAHDLIGSRVVRIEECHVVDSHWRGVGQEFNLYVGDSFACRVQLVTPETKAEHGNV
jgi:hypothetical protein